MATICNFIKCQWFHRLFAAVNQKTWRGVFSVLNFKSITASPSLVVLKGILLWCELSRYNRSDQTNCNDIWNHTFHTIAFWGLSSPPSSRLAIDYGLYLKLYQSAKLTTRIIAYEWMAEKGCVPKRTTKYTAWTESFNWSLHFPLSWPHYQMIIQITKLLCSACHM